MSAGHECHWCGRNHDADRHRNLAEVAALPDVVELVTIDEDSGGTYDDGSPIILTHHVALEVKQTNDVWHWLLWTVMHNPYGHWTKGVWNPSRGTARTRDLAIADARTARANHTKWKANYGKQIPERFSW